MSNDPDSRAQPKRSVPASREAERAAALRANLLRRKAQSRNRNETQGEPRPKPPADA